MLPGDVKIELPASNLPPVLAAYSGTWSGSLCKGRYVDIKFAVERIVGNSARVVYASATKRRGRFSERLTMQYAEGELEGAFREGARIAARMRSDGAMDFLWRWNSRHWCSGVLKRK